MKKTLFLFISGILMFSCQEDMDENIHNQEGLNGKAGLITLKSGIVVEKRGDYYILGGDMILSPSQLRSLEEKGNLLGDDSTPKDGADTTLHPVFNIPMSVLNTDGNTLPRNLGMNADPYRLWAMVRFTYGPSILNHYDKDFYQRRIRKAMQQIQNQTNVRFYNATGKPTKDPTWNIDYPYVEINYIDDSNDVSLSSRIGRNPAGGKQELYLADFAFPYSESSNVTTIVHELCHAIGMMHEQNRPDRDNYVTINTSNLKPMGRSQFQRVTTNYSYFGAYDYGSIMGYNSFTSASSIVYNTSEPMYTKKDKSYITRSETLTYLDRIWLNHYHLPYIARSDVYRELDSIVYRPDNTVMTADERLQLQAYLNNGNSNPPPGGRIPNDL